MTKRIMVSRIGICADCRKRRVVFRHNRPLNGMMFRNHCYLCQTCHPDHNETKKWLAFFRLNELDCTKPVYRRLAV